MHNNKVYLYMALSDQFNIKHNFIQNKGRNGGGPHSISPSVWGSLAWKTLKTPWSSKVL